jgi:four helix bundle protein
MLAALVARAMANKLEELPIYPKANEFWTAVNALLQLPALGRNRKLHQQIEEANDSVLANMAEGFQQPTDKALEKYLFVAKGSVAEVLSRLMTARRKGYISARDHEGCRTMGDELLRMLGGWIAYLARCDWKDRGRRCGRGSQ